MPLLIPASILKKTVGAELAQTRQYLNLREEDGDVAIDISRLSEKSIKELLAVATKEKNGTMIRTLKSLLSAYEGDFAKPVPNHNVFAEILIAYLRSDLIDGWIYVEEHDGKRYPELVTSIQQRDRQLGSPAQVILRTVRLACATKEGDNEYSHDFRAHVFTPDDVRRKRIVDILNNKNIRHETPALREEYLSSMKRFKSLVSDRFSEQFIFTGKIFKHEKLDQPDGSSEIKERKVIHDVEPDAYRTMVDSVESILLEGSSTDCGVIPDHPHVRVFDLKTHESYWVHADFLSPYEYDLTLREKIVLPPTHRDLLDILTTDLSSFTGDIIDGKTAGNIILCKGIPGVGKTLTAEIYSELIQKPLYSIHSGSLGTSARSIEENLSKIFNRSQRWGCVLLLDEADVFVSKRKDNIENNAIVAEFLRTLEYFSGLLFMTTNRPDDIDEAIISRCAAIIDYAPPSPKDAAKIWEIMSENFGAGLDREMIEGLVDLFPGIAPRDIKMVLRLVLKMHNGRQEPITLDLFRKCAMFRAVKMAGMAEKM